MDHLDGKSLDRHLAHERGGVLELREAARVAAHVLAGLEVLHGLRIVHRDIKPANVVRTRRADGSALYTIIDLGIAIELRDRPKHTPLHAAWATMRTVAGAAEVVGTLPYMSPEMFSDPDSVGPQADLWSVAVMVFQLISGSLPFEAAESWQWPAAIAGRDDDAAPSIRSRVAPSLRQTIPDEIVSALASALQKETGLRTASAEVMRASFVGCLPGAGEPRVLAFFSKTLQDDLKVHQEAQVLVRMLQATQWVFERDLNPQPTVSDYARSLGSAVSRNVRVIHFAGHSTHEGFQFLTDDGATGSAAASLEQICEATAKVAASAHGVGTVECVLINACSSEHMARMLRHAGVPHVVCWRTAVKDATALAFSQTFYSVLSTTPEGRGYACAFEKAAAETGATRCGVGHAVHSAASDKAVARAPKGLTNTASRPPRMVLDHVLFLSESGDC
eukprot:1473563-Rhodomonas_salina.1